MSAEDLSAGFLNLQRLQARDETFESNVAGAVQYNADLLNLLVTQVNALEAATVMSNEGLQKASDFTMEGFQKASDFSTDLDKKLRAHIDEAILAMKVDFDRLEATAQAAQPGVDFGKIGKAFDDLQGQLTATSARLSGSFELLQTQQTAAVTRVESLEVTSNLVLKESTENFATIVAKFTELEALYHGSGAAPAPAQTQSTAADPLANGADSWSTWLNKGGKGQAQIPAFSAAAQMPPLSAASFGARPQSM